MTTQEYNEARAALGLTMVGAARLFEVNERTGRRWASGEQDIPKAVEIALRLMVRYRVKPERFMA